MKKTITTIAAVAAMLLFTAASAPIRAQQHTAPVRVAVVVISNLQHHFTYTEAVVTTISPDDLPNEQFLGYAEKQVYDRFIGTLPQPIEDRWQVSESYLLSRVGWLNGNDAIISRLDAPEPRRPAGVTSIP